MDAENNHCKISGSYVEVLNDSKGLTVPLHSTNFYFHKVSKETEREISQKSKIVPPNGQIIYQTSSPIEVRKIRFSMRSSVT